MTLDLRHSRYFVAIAEGEGPARLTESGELRLW